MGHCHGNCLLPFSRQRSDAQYPAADRALPERYDSVHATPLLCAGLIGFRAWRLAGKASPRRLRLYGFGAAAHLICQIAVFQGQEVYAFTHPGDTAGQDFARSLGAVWAGGSNELPLQGPHVQVFALGQANAAVQTARSTVRQS